MEIESMEPIDIQALLEEDQEAGKDVPFRFGYGIEVDFDLGSSGTWEELENGDRVWRLAIKSPNAYSINIVYDDFYLPDGGEFYVYSADKNYIIGAFTEGNNKEDGVFATQPVPGDHVILEYFEPKIVSGKGRIQL
ncbi:MAG: T9SS C-terminal target domain-containing protein, partial [Candidatus Marinimicrobia bacterium]|nr:T9SS C-terminal target domain-containing protein [Candidatus Neomarinimicrobiota bacterium]